jgi:hypothetical protein
MVAAMKVMRLHSKESPAFMKAMMKSKEATEIRGIIREASTNKITMGVNGTTVLINKMIIVINGTIASEALIKIDGTILIINKITMVINGIVVIQILLVNGMLATKQIMETIKVNGVKTIMEANGRIIMANNIKTIEMAAAMIKETIGAMQTNGIIK